MLIFSLLGWWYSKGWGTAASKLGSEVRHLGETFSVRILLTSLFKPWKQIRTVPTQGATLGDRWRAIVDNLVSRIVGFGVRSLTLFTALLMMAVIAVVGSVTIIIWPLLPLSVILLVAKATGL